LLGLIGSYLGKDHTAWPSQSTLARDLGVTRKAVNEGIKALVTYGYVQAQTRYREDGGQTSSVYFVVMDPVDRVAAEGYTPSNRGVTPPSPERATPCNPMEVTPPVTSGGYTKDTIERTKEEDAFEEAWKAYQASPLKANQTKKLAKAQWPKAVAKAGDARILLAAINA
jgi:DNA-binding transcriptional MocR family regulator